MNRHEVLSALALVVATFLLGPTGESAPAHAEASQRGRAFLSSLVDPELGLLPEYRGAKVYWLFHDNYLAAKVLAKSHPKIAERLLNSIHSEGVHRSGKIELLFGDAEGSLSFRHYELVEVRRAGEKIIRTERVTDSVMAGWEGYADLLLLACIAETSRTNARRHWEAALKLWDGEGFMDAAAVHAKHYATYKLGLALIAAGKLSPPASVPPGLTERLLALQADSGGWITDYDKAGKRIGLANVETTCLAILGLEASLNAKTP